MTFTFFKNPDIYFPEKYNCVSYSVPEIELSSKQAVACGYSFRKKDYSVKITNYHGKSAKKLIIPYKIDGMTVDEICDKAFENAKFTKLYIHGKIKKIGKGAFSNSNVQTVVIADGIKRIPERMFRDCKNLAEINIPPTVKSIGKSAFEDCASLEFIAFPQSIRDIGDFVFLDSGLKRFAIETDNNFIPDGKTFYGSPIANEYDVICTSFAGNPLKVAYVKCGSFKFNEKYITFLPNSLICASKINLESCSRIHFYRNAFDDHRSYCGMRMFDKNQFVILPEGYGAKYGYYFPDYVTVKNYFYTNYFCIDENGNWNEDVNSKSRKLSPYIVRTNGDKADVEVITSYLPSWTLKLPHRHIKIGAFIENVEKYAIDCCNAETVYIDYIHAEGEIFSPYCHNLHKVTWKNDNCKYIPPSSLIGYFLHNELLKAFAPVSAQVNGRYKRYFFNREIIDDIFTSKFYECKYYYYHTRRIRISNKAKVLIAIDVLRSTQLSHEKSTEIYSNFLMNHQKYAHDVCELIKDKYPDYAETLKVL